MREAEKSNTLLTMPGIVKNCFGISKRMAMGEDRTSPRMPQYVRAPK